jgi:hypothetical protein
VKIVRCRRRKPSGREALSNAQPWWRRTRLDTQRGVDVRGRRRRDGRPSRCTSRALGRRPQESEAIRASSLRALVSRHRPGAARFHARTLVPQHVLTGAQVTRPETRVQRTDRNTIGSGTEGGTGGGRPGARDEHRSTGRSSSNALSVNPSTSARAAPSRVREAASRRRKLTEAEGAKIARRRGSKELRFLELQLTLGLTATHAGCRASRHGRATRSRPTIRATRPGGEGPPLTGRHVASVQLRDTPPYERLPRGRGGAQRWTSQPIVDPVLVEKHSGRADGKSKGKGHHDLADEFYALLEEARGPRASN